MATLTVTNLPEDVHAALQQRAAEAGHSPEEEVRLALAAAVGLRLTETDMVGFDRGAALAAASELQRMVLAANGGRMPDDSVDQFIAHKRAEVAREEAAYAVSLAVRGG